MECMSRTSEVLIASGRVKQNVQRSKMTPLSIGQTRKERESKTYRGSLIGSRHWATVVQFRASARAEKVKERRIGTLGS